MHLCEGESAELWCALLKLLSRAMCRSCSAMGVGQPGLVLEPSDPSGPWEAANGLSAGGYGLPETLLRVGKRHRFHPRAQGQSWRGKTVGDEALLSCRQIQICFPMPWGARQAGFSVQAPLHSSQLRTHCRLSLRQWCSSRHWAPVEGEQQGGW